MLNNEMTLVRRGIVWLDKGVVLFSFHPYSHTSLLNKPISVCMEDVFG